MGRFLFPEAAGAKNIIQTGKDLGVNNMKITERPHHLYYFFILTDCFLWQSTFDIIRTNATIEIITLLINFII